MLENILIRLIPILINQASPEILRAMKSMTIEMKKQAKKTSNPIDDILVYILDGFLSELNYK